jgi:hypothetical protein
MHSPQNSPAPAANLAERPPVIASYRKARRSPIRTTILLVICLGLALFVGLRFVQSRGPTIELARAALQRTIGEQSAGKGYVVSFTKDDGQKGEVGGIKTYVMAFHSIVAFKDAGTWISKDSVDPNQLTFKFARGSQGRGAVVELNNIVLGGKAVRADQWHIIDGVMFGEKSENGWNFSLREGRIRELPN